MNRRLRLLLTLAALPLAALLSLPAQADNGHRSQRSHDQQSQRQHKAPQLSPSQAADLAQQRAGGGRVLSVRGHGDGYRVKLLLRDGTVRVVHVSGER